MTSSFVGFDQHDIGNHILVDNDAVRHDPGNSCSEDGYIVAEMLAEVEAVGDGRNELLADGSYLWAIGSLDGRSNKLV